MTQGETEQSALARFDVGERGTHMELLRIAAKHADPNDDVQDVILKAEALAMWVEGRGTGIVPVPSQPLQGGL